MKHTTEQATSTNAITASSPGPIDKRVGANVTRVGHQYSDWSEVWAPTGWIWHAIGGDLQANLVRLDRGDRISPHRDDQVEVVVVVVSGRGKLTLDGQVHPLAPLVVAHLPEGTVRAIAAVDGPLAYLSVHRRRSAGLQVGRHAQRR